MSSREANSFDRTGSILCSCVCHGGVDGINPNWNVPCTRRQSPASSQRRCAGKIVRPLQKQAKRTGFVPESGIRRMKPADFVETWGAKPVLLLQPTKDTPSSGLA